MIRPGSYQGQCASFYLPCLLSLLHRPRSLKGITIKTVTFHISAWLSKRCLSEMCRAEEKWPLVCLGSRWGGTGPAIRTLWANIELQEHKDLQHEQMFSELYSFLWLWSKSILCCAVCARSTVAGIYWPHQGGKCRTNLNQKSLI